MAKTALTPALIRRAAPGARRKPREGSAREEATESKAEAASEPAGMKGGGRLTAGQRRAIPKGDFGVPSKAPGSGSYPMENPAHARAALSMAHFAPESEQATIKAKARGILGRKAGPSSRR